MVVGEILLGNNAFLSLFFLVHGVQYSLIFCHIIVLQIFCQNYDIHEMNKFLDSEIIGIDIK